MVTNMANYLLNFKLFQGQPFRKGGVPRSLLQCIRIDICDERERTPKFRECIELLELAHACLIDALSRVDAVLQNPSPEVVLFHDALSLI